MAHAPCGHYAHQRPCRRGRGSGCRATAAVEAAGTAWRVRARGRTGAAMGTVFLRRRGCGQSPSAPSCLAGPCVATGGGKMPPNEPRLARYRMVGLGWRTAPAGEACSLPRTSEEQSSRSAARLGAGGVRGDAAACNRARLHAATGPAARWSRPQFPRAGTPRRAGPRRTARPVTAPPVGGHRQTSAAAQAGRCAAAADVEHGSCDIPQGAAGACRRSPCHRDTVHVRASGVSPREARPTIRLRARSGPEREGSRPTPGTAPQP